MAERVDDREVRQGLRSLMAFGPAAVAEALNKVAFELRDAEADEVARAFEFSGANTESFLASPRSFVFQGATADRLVVEFTPKDRPTRILRDHLGGTTISPDRNRLALGDRLAVPIGVKRSARGRVPQAQAPGAVLARQRKRGAVFVTKAGGAILQRLAGGGVRVLYALIPSAKLEKRLRYYEVALETVRRELPVKARQVWAKFDARRTG